MFLKAWIKAFFACLQHLLGPLLYGDKLLVVTGATGDLGEFQSRLQHFAPFLEGQYLVVDRLPYLAFLSSRPIVLLAPPYAPWLAKIASVYVLDHEGCAEDAWNWFRLAVQQKPEFMSAAISASRQRFVVLAERLRTEHEKCYIFGTGSSLERAEHHDWSDGIRIVSNTIVKDQALWRHMQPDIIVAGDALYHFGHTEFAVSFRRDLAARLAETETSFIYPSIFHELVVRELQAFESRLIPIPMGDSQNPIQNLLETYELPSIGNVLNLLLLPVACTLSKDVYLWGFDGRAPNDQMFWKNSERHFYQDHVSKLQAAHPAFFSHHVPKVNPGQYVNSVHGDKLDGDLADAERRGWHFTLLHKSWTFTLQKRYRYDSRFAER